MKRVEITGQKFGYLTVIRPIGSRWGHSLWECKCDCGTVCERTSNQLTQNKNVSCGCMTSLAQHNARYLHGCTGTRLYRIWKVMKTRCNNPNISYFKYYGGKGISVCEEWINSFETFKEWALSHGYSDTLTIDRINGDGNYEPDNCRWVTMTVQNRNKKKVRECLKTYQKN